MSHVHFRRNGYMVKHHKKHGFGNSNKRNKLLLLWDSIIRRIKQLGERYGW